MKPIVYMALLFVAHTLHGQLARDPIFNLPDSAKPFTLSNFYEVILRYHPVAKQAELLSDVAKQELRLARGSFDPKLEAQYLLKHYKKTEYYRLFDAAIKLPTRSPVMPTVGLERNKGQNLDPENYISPEDNYRQLYAGIAIPLGRGLMTDERRTALRQAEQFGNLMAAEQVKTINKLLLDAAKQYWNWYYAYYNYRLSLNTLRIAEEIFTRTRANFIGGELAPIDTVQSKITFLERQVARQEAWTQYRNASLTVSTFLWDSLLNPVDLTAQHAPVNQIDLIVLPNVSLEELVNQAKANHPELVKVNVKLAQLENERRLAAEFLKPRLDLSYYMLNQPFTTEGLASSFAFDENYKLGLDFSFPLFLRKERAKLAQTKLKVSSTVYDRDQATRQIVNDINTAYNELVNNGIVLRQQQEMVENYYRLMNAELLNLENGESDLFKINVQQEKLFNAESKLIKVIAEYEKQKAVLYWSAGVQPVR